MSKVLFPLDDFVQTGRHRECLDPTVHLGHVATAEGVSTDLEKVQAMLNLRTLRGLLKYLLEQRVPVAVQQRGLTKLLGLDYELWKGKIDIGTHGDLRLQLLNTFHDSTFGDHSWNIEEIISIVLMAYDETDGYRTRSHRHALQVIVFVLLQAQSGIDKSWRDNKSISFAIPYFKPSVCISGFIYEFIIKGAIAAIDVKSETIALRNSTHESVYHYELIEVKGKLEVIDYRKWVNGYLDLWILDQTPQRKWERHIIGVPSIWNAIKPRFVSSLMARDGEIAFVIILKSGACLCYDFTRKSWRELEIMGLPKENCIRGIYSYVESLISLG
ncbi:hypothetical protein MTR67_002886 [Solanum verrucosum]|uniref:F-box associated beta-propeller type 3 domain-containing protein n=1 Tax=Solanum verrucosum TaxID=315347 RepID=A0AAF0T8V5_SOLVR|nr:hypothetical protein MTR67_002886 [Solanum verrucosum]